MDWIEIVGYMASVLIAVSLMMSNILKLRVINLIGAATFAGYGLVNSVYPVFFVNGWISLVNCYFLWKLLRSSDDFDLIYVKNRSSVFLQKFLKFYEKDIKQFNPGFLFDDVKHGRIVYIVRNMIPVGLFISEPVSHDTIEVKLDYTIPAYRDLKNARYLYSKGVQDCWSEGYQEIITRTEIPAHRSYLERVGFQVDQEDGTLYRLTGESYKK